MSEYFTTDEAAIFLGVTPSRIRQLISEGRLISNKLGRDHLLQKYDLEQYAKHGKKKRGRPLKINKK